VQVVQLNAAGRHVAQSLGINVVDVEKVTWEFAETEGHLRDTHHPKAFVNMNLLNIYLNMAMQV
jgi:hypothetical protein